MKYFYLTLCGVFFFSCNPDSSKSSTETLEIYSTKGNAVDKSVDSLKYFESTSFIDGRKASVSYFDKNGVLVGKEVFKYNEQNVLVSADYSDQGGTLLSRYKYIVDNQGRTVAEYGFDAKTDQLLRVKTFVYDEKGQIATRIVREADHTINRKYDILYDQDGNESSIWVRDGRDSSVLIEKFTITKKDSTNKWVERWGFVNDLPYTFYQKK